MDLIYLFILTPVTIAVMYGAHCIKRNNNTNNIVASTFRIAKKVCDKFARCATNARNQHQSWMV